MKRFLTLTAILVFTLFSVACGFDSQPSLSTNKSELVYVSGDSCFTLYAGQTINAGQVCAAIDGDNLKVTFTTTGGWELVEAHGWAGESLADMPQSRNGNPKIGNFPYNSGALNGATTWSFSVPLSQFGGEPAICGKTILVAAHAALRKSDGNGGYQTETGWADGTRMVQRGSWATYFSVEVQCKDDEPPTPGPKTCETAFAKGDTTFIDLGLTTGRWGWELGPISSGSTVTTKIYAGAGQNDITKGTHVGNLTVVYNGSSATVTYNMLSGFTMDETHVYVGHDHTTTIAPGQYGNTTNLSDATTNSVTVTGLNGSPIYVVAHAVTCSTSSN